jgi:hypothetical protein
MARPDMRNVYSSHVDRIGYDPDSGELHVHWSNGSTGFYGGVPPEKARSVLTAPSIGQELHRVIRGQHEFSYTSKPKKGGVG